MFDDGLNSASCQPGSAGRLATTLDRRRKRIRDRASCLARLERGSIYSRRLSRLGGAVFNSSRIVLAKWTAYFALEARPRFFCMHAAFSERLLAVLREVYRATRVFLRNNNFKFSKKLSDLIVPTIRRAAATASF